MSDCINCKHPVKEHIWNTVTWQPCLQSEECRCKTTNRKEEK